MNNKLIAVALLATSAFTGSALAAAGTVKFNGTILDKGCDIVGGTNDQTVQMGSIAKSEFTGAGSTPVTAAKGFNLQLTNCPDTVSLASVRFDGIQVPNDNSVLALTEEDGVAKGVGIQISDAKNKVVNLYQDSSEYPLLPGAEVNQLDFTARYIATAADVEPGKANAVTTFSIVYQ